MESTTRNEPWLAGEEDKRAYVKGMFAEVAPSYDLINSLMSFRLHHRWRKAAVRALDLKVGGRALDVCSGTGDFLAPLRQAVGADGEVVGTDFCAPMLERAAPKAGPIQARLALADACNLPFSDGGFDGVSVGWGLRNVPDVPAALGEAFRVLAPGGRFVTLDMARPQSKLLGKASETMFHKVVPVIGRVFGKSQAYTYLPKSTVQFLTREEMKQAMVDAGFQDVGWKDFYFGNVCLHWGRKP